VAQGQCDVGIVAICYEFSGSVEEWRSRYTQDPIIAIEAGLIATCAARDRGNDHRKR
jgi:hypothetical protein